MCASFRKDLTHYQEQYVGLCRRKSYVYAKVLLHLVVQRARNVQDMEMFTLPKIYGLLTIRVPSLIAEIGHLQSWISCLSDHIAVSFLSSFLCLFVS